MTKEKRKPPSPEEQVVLRAAMEELHGKLLGKAILFVNKMVPPKPDPHELVNETFIRVLSSYADSNIESVSGLAFTTLTRLCFDSTKKGRKFNGGFIEDDTAVPDPRPHAMGDPFVRAAFAKLTPKEQCVLIRRVIEKVAVEKAFKLCGWQTPSAPYELKKLFDKLNMHLQGAGHE
jgi:DNA-directed RNA polymerase specialized sigma24 family protein